ncbi:hypothetical protein Ae717Ps2_6605c [Pseudonocardia sp. Ae717_Ps2]|uniref:type IV secretory system conjugative DNA transfer family protein n=1 Tax=Pseudonocardia sp. Ae717_Ps2 TaxID=1885573 RepID=UPI00094B60E6|nr:type IV secretory system conjugative DNA transfer family protein [Pseudonocardia sp. Ae717_Ps2]OLM28266.1 hypothetical protein Ae717Ps2_6605c [Pseudonocardia sp. Ae717_Ps2]
MTGAAVRRLSGGPPQRTEHEVRAVEVRVGAAGAAAAVGSAVLGAATGVPLVDAIALLGGAAGSVTAAAAACHHRYYFEPNRRFRRELGGPAGWLDEQDLRSTAGADAVRQLAVGTWGERDPWAHHVAVSGWEAGRLVSGPRRLRGRRVYSPWARGIGILGPQGSGKTQYLIRMLLDAPGAVVAPSTKPELAEATLALRAESGPVYVFNPGRLGTLENTFRWNPVAGCADQAIADKRAWALVRGGTPPGGSERQEFWSLKAQEIIRCYLMAAALSGRGMDAVAAWANRDAVITSEERRRGTTADDPAQILRGHARAGGPVPPGWVETLETHLGAAPNTKTGYFATVTPSVGFMDNPTVAEACRPGADELDVHAFLAGRGTLYMIGGSGDRRLAPLLTALTEHLFDEAQRVAARYGGRLPTTLAFLLDEVANITPVPLDRWAADSRGWGITVCAVLQSLAQLATTWGRDAGHVIWENLPTKVILPGVANPDDLDHLSYLGGQRWVARESEGASIGADGRHGHSVSTQRTREPVMAGDVISRMPAWHAYVLGLARHPAVVRYEPGYRLVARARAANGVGAGRG